MICSLTPFSETWRQIAASFRRQGRTHVLGGDRRDAHPVVRLATGGDGLGVRRTGTDDRERALRGRGNSRNLYRPSGEVPVGVAADREERGQTWDSVDEQTGRGQWEAGRGA